VVSVADGFDAMTTGRPYRPPRSVPDALDQIRQGAGTQWDGDAVDAFLKVCRDAEHLPLPTPAVSRRRVPQRIAAGAIGTPRR
jgi:HD-GYP domain-containing protein (c-di-GMP phosphodiesterase class II)